MSDKKGKDSVYMNSLEYLMSLKAISFLRLQSFDLYFSRVIIKIYNDRGKSVAYTHKNLLNFIQDVFNQYYAVWLSHSCSGNLNELSRSYSFVFNGLALLCFTAVGTYIFI